MIGRGWHRGAGEAQRIDTNAEVALRNRGRPDEVEQELNETKHLLLPSRDR